MGSTQTDPRRGHPKAPGMDPEEDAMAPGTPMTVAEIFRTITQPISFEIFPPKGDMTLEDAHAMAAELAPLDPAFISVTHSAGGSGNGGSTVEVASLIQRDFQVPTVAHLTCQGLTRRGLQERMEAMAAAGIVNVLALRGDPRPDLQPGDYAYAADMIPELVEAGFCVGAAAYPEGHLSCLDLDKDVEYLKAKVDAGASFLVTQLFFDNDLAYRFQEKLGRASIDVPVTYGIMPFLSKQQVTRMIFTCGASLPARIVKLLAHHEDDPVALRQAGIDYACDQLRDLAVHGVDGLHVYTMNKPAVARAAVEAIRSARVEA